MQVAHCPERVLPGRILHELVATTPRHRRHDADLRRSAPASSTGSLRAASAGSTDARTAELAKLAENAYRDVNIAFANELSLICDRLRVDVWELIGLANRHPRVDILQPRPRRRRALHRGRPLVHRGGQPGGGAADPPGAEVNDAQPRHRHAPKVRERAAELQATR